VAKGPEAFRSISEAADALGVPQHVLRFWETKFSFIRPMKRAGGRRFYRPQDIAVLRGVRRLLHDDGYTIKGVQRLHREEGVRRVLAAGVGTEAPTRGIETPVIDPGPIAPAPIELASADPALVEPALVEPAPVESARVEPPPAEALELQPAARRPRPVLSDLDRRKLTAALEDLTQIKADIDALLAQK